MSDQFAETNPASSLLGTLVKGRYRIQKMIGRGGFGAIYLAHDEELRNRPVVVKLLAHDSSDAAWFERKFAQEIEALSRINHPSVVAVIDAGQMPDNQPYMVLQFVEGRTLNEALKAGPMDFHRAASLLRQLGNALSAAHEKGVCHRDLKPSNVMLSQPADGEEHLTLIDFGIATLEDSESATGTEKTKVAGTFTYMAPEQFEGRPVAASDIYSMGIIAWETLIGAPPAANRPMFELMLMQREGTWPKMRDLRPSLPERAQTAILNALSFQPERRVASARELGDELAAALTMPEPAAAPPPPPVQGKKRRGLWVLPLMLGLGAAGYGIYEWRKPEPPPPPATMRDVLSYSIAVQRYRDGKPYREPFLLSREIAFELDYRIRLSVEALETGHLYLINEAPQGDVRYAILFPSTTANDGSSLLAKGARIRVPEETEFEFDGQTGTEKIWFLWSRESIPALAALPAGPVREAAGSAGIQDALRAPAAAVRTDDAAHRTVLGSTSNRTVYLVQLIHQ